MIPSLLYFFLCICKPCITLYIICNKCFNVIYEGCVCVCVCVCVCIYRCILCCLTSIFYISRPASLLLMHLIFFIPSPLHWYPHSSNSFYMPSTIFSLCFILLLSTSSCSLLMLSYFLMLESITL